MEANNGNRGTETLSEFPAIISRSDSSPSIRFRRKCASIAMAAACIFGASLANATLINFDDLPPLVGDDPTEPTPVTNQYAALGVTFQYGAIHDGDHVLSPPNGLSDFYGPGLEIYFSGVLPTYVSFYVSSSNEDSVGINASGPAGYVSSVETDGWRGTEENSTPYRDQQFVSFAGSEISRLSLGTYYNRRGALIIDDLTFTHDVASVPEPSMLTLFAGGIGLLILRRRRAA